jgi:hypothetical protein
MIDPKTIWQLEEKTEDAFVAYLLDTFTGFDAHVAAGMSAAKYLEPGVYVVAMISENVGEQAGFTGHRELAVVFTLRTAAEIGTDGSFKTSRDQHGELKSRTMTALVKDDILALVNAKTDGTVKIDQANVEGITRGMNTEENYHETTITVLAIARPVET